MLARTPYFGETIVNPWKITQRLVLRLGDVPVIDVIMIKGLILKAEDFTGVLVKIEEISWHFFFYYLIDRKYKDFVPRICEEVLDLSARPVLTLTFVNISSFSHKNRSVRMWNIVRSTTPIAASILRLYVR